MLVFCLLVLSLIQTAQPAEFEDFGKRGKALAEIGGLANLEKAANFFKKQRSSAKSKRQGFTAINNVAVTMLRIGNSKHPASRAIDDYQVALKSWRKCLKLNPKSKKVRKNLQLLDIACRRRYHGAPSCDEALREGSQYQQSPKFVRSVFKGNLAVDVSTAGTLNVDTRNRVYVTASTFITAGMKGIREYKQSAAAKESDEDQMDGMVDASATKVPEKLGDAMFAFTQASALQSHLRNSNNGEDISGNSDSDSGMDEYEDDSNGALDYIVALNNVAAIYLTLAINTLGTMNMDRNVVDQTSELVDEAQRVMQSIVPFERQVRQVHKEGSTSTSRDADKLKSSVAVNRGIIERLRRQCNEELKLLRSDVPILIDNTQIATPRRAPQFPSVDRIHWPPSQEHLASYGFDTIPSVGAYVRRRNTPVVIQGTNGNDIDDAQRTVDVWRLQQKWGNTSYLRQHMKPVIQVSMTDRAENLYGTDTMDTRMHIHEFFARLDHMNQTHGQPHDGKHPYTSFDIDIDHIPPGDILMDDLASTNFNDVSAGYYPLGKQMKLILWIGASNVSAVGHYDHAYNCFLMLSGSKRFIVAPPSSSIDLYFHPAPSHSHRQSQMRDFDHVDEKIYSRASTVPFQEANVQPGEIMYLPPLWIHSVESTTGPSVALSAWSYPGDVLSCIDELSNDFRRPTGVLLMKYIDATSSHTVAATLHLVTYTKFISTVLLKVFHRSSSSDNSSAGKLVGDGSASAFLEALLESKYSNKDSDEAECTSAAVCPTDDDFYIIPSLLNQMIEKESMRRAKMLGAEGIHASPLGTLLEVGAHVPLMMASVEYLSHVSQSFGRTIGHGDDAGKKVCHFVRECLLPLLRKLE